MLPKPVTLDDAADLRDLAVQLAGRPVPGVRMTEAEFEAWCDPDVRAEWVDGEIVLLPPENWPSVTLAGWLSCVLGRLVEQDDLGQVVARDFIVRLPRQRRRRAPDLFFVAKVRLGLIQHTFMQGPPDLVIEIVSPDSESRDWRDKYNEYQRAGVREYWIFDPASQRVEAYALGKNKRYALILEQDGLIPSAVLPGFHIRSQWLRAAKLPRVAKVLKELGVRG